MSKKENILIYGSVLAAVTSFPLTLWKDRSVH